MQVRSKDVIHTILNILTTRTNANPKFTAGVLSQKCMPDEEKLCGPGGNTCLNSPAEAVWLAGGLTEQILNKESVEKAPGYELFTRLQDNQITMSISDDILWWGLTRNLAYAGGGGADIIKPNLQIVEAFQQSWDTTCQGGVVWGCLVSAGGWISGGEKNAVTNLLLLLNILQILSLQADETNKQSLIAFAKKSWSWLKQAAPDAAGLVEYTRGIVHDKFRPVNDCAPAGCLKAKFPGTNKSYWPTVPSKTECNSPTCHTGPNWPRSWDDTTKKTTWGLCGDCRTSTTYNQGLLIGCMVQMHILRTNYNIDIEKGFDYLGLAVKAFNVTIDGTLPDLSTTITVKNTKYSNIIKGEGAPWGGRCNIDNPWFRAIFFWFTSNLYTILVNENKSEAETVANVIKTNWDYVSNNALLTTGDEKYLGTADWWTPSSSVGPFKYQLSLLWLALASELVQDPKSAQTLLCYKERWGCDGTVCKPMSKGTFSDSKCGTGCGSTSSHNTGLIVGIGIGIGILGIAMVIFLIIRYRKR